MCKCVLCAWMYVHVYMLMWGCTHVCSYQGKADFDSRYFLRLLSLSIAPEALWLLQSSEPKDLISDSENPHEYRHFSTPRQLQRSYGEMGRITLSQSLGPASLAYTLVNSEKAQVKQGEKQELTLRIVLWPVHPHTIGAYIHVLIHNT